MRSIGDRFSARMAIEMLARGLSVRDIEDAFKDEHGRLLLSKTAVSQLGERLWEDYQAFTQRDLGEYEIAYLFVDGIAERLRPSAKREPVLAAWGFTIEGRRVLLHMMAGSKEDAETVTAFFEDMKRRGLNDPLLVTSDGAPGIVKGMFGSSNRGDLSSTQIHGAHAPVEEPSTASEADSKRPVCEIVVTRAGLRTLIGRCHTKTSLTKPPWPINSMVVVVVSFFLLCP